MDKIATEEYFDDRIEDDINFGEILQRYLKQWRWFVLSITLMLTLGYMYAKVQKPQFSVNIKILIKDKEQANDKDILQQLNLYNSDKIIDNEIQILKTNMLMEKVVQSLELQNTFTVEKGLSTNTLYNMYLPFKLDLLSPSKSVNKDKWTVQYINDEELEFAGKKIPYNHPVMTEAGLLIATHQYQKVPNRSLMYVSFGTTEGTAQYFLNKLAISPASKQATVLFISIEDEIPERGKAVLTKLVDVYNQMSIDDKNKTTANTLSFIEGRLTAVASELNGVEGKVEKYKSTNGIVDISAQSAIFLANVQANDAAITKIDLEFGILKNLEQYLNSGITDLTKLPSMQGIEDPSLTAMVAQLGESQIKKESLLRTIPETNPIVASLNDQIKALKFTILKTLQNVRSGLVDSRKQLEIQNANYQSTLKGVPTKERGLIDVMRDRDIKNGLFTFLLQKREETQISLASTVSDSKTIDQAKSSGMYFKPAKNVIYIAFLTLGFLLPILIIYLKNALNLTIKRRSDIEKITKVPVTGQISFYDMPNPMVAIEQPRSMIAEQIRALRTNLEFIMPGIKSKNILFTSNISGEGKSFISLNLGASLASTGKKVIVLELDLRKPRFYITLGLNNDIGLSSYLIDKSTLEEVTNKISSQDNFFVITSGVIPPNPAELLLNGRIEILIAELKKEYDYIIMDAPPVGLLTDAQILSQYADTTFFIVRYNYTSKESIHILEDFRRRKIFKNLNIIYNSVDNRRGGYGYGYSYGYGYYEDNEPKKTFWSRILNR